VTTPADEDSGARSAFAALPSPLAAVDDMRAAAKWTLAAAGAVGAALISGGPLVAVGQVHGVLHAVIAGLGLLAALCGVGLAIWSTTKVLASRLTTPATLASPELAKFREVVEADREQFFGVIAKDVAGLLRYQVIAVHLMELRAAKKDDPRQQAMIAAQLHRVMRDAARADPYVRWLLTAAHAWLVEAELKRSRKWTLIGGILVVAGAVLFFSVTGNSGPTYVPVLTPQVTAVPSASTVPAASP
jgi:hypothetical protein